MIRLDILTAVARHDSCHMPDHKADTLFITEKQWDELVEGNIGDLQIIDDTCKGKRVFLGLDVEFISRGDLRVGGRSNK